MRPKPRPSAPVATNRIGYAAAPVFMGTVAASKPIARVLERRPTSKTDFSGNRRANFGSANEPAMARTTWGTNIKPYWVLDRS